MILATIIRLEMAYPGVGILAGDSLQYLSVVTAHAVIMVFFMIMPLIFGAFGNFLLPTQLGVHDVAFPRLNSAAFWFLPAGLLMLCQLVCLDRRYQRMNCFNVREVEALLKGRFFPDLIQSYDHRLILNNSILSLRFKQPNLATLSNSTLLFQSFGLTLADPKRVFESSNNFSTYTDAYSLLQLNSYASAFWSPLLQSQTKNIFRLAVDSYIFITTFLSNNYTGELDSRVYRGFQAILDWFAFWFSYLQSEFERLAIGFVFIADSSKPTYLNFSWFLNFKISLLDKFLYGFMESNMGVYKLVTRSWPEPRLLEIKTDGGFTEFYVTAADQLLCFSFFLYAEVIRDSFCDFIKRLTVRFSNFVFAVQLYWTQPFNWVFVQDLLCLGGFPSLPLLISTWIQLPTTLKLYSNCLLTGSAPFSTILSELSLFWPHLSSQKGALTQLMNNTHQNHSLLLDSKAAYTKELIALSENNTYFRFQRALNPVFRYDYKLGNYFTKEDTNIAPFLFTTINDVTGGIRKSSWFFSKKFIELFSTNFSSELTSATLSHKDIGNKNNPYVQNTFPYYNIFSLFADDYKSLTSRWLAFTSFDQKFHRMFLTSSMQQRIFSNWRQLRFTREAWRCKLLVARHQKTLYKRYTDEDGLFWSIERNAKDVLPGWAMITPFSARTRFTAIGKVDIGLLGVFLVLNSSIVSSANFLVTYRYLSTLNNRKMRDARSFFTEGVMVASWMMIAANPMLVIGILMLLSDRHWQTSFFDYSGGGDTVLFQHMFWFFGHPEVYVIMIPAFGFNNTILSFYLRKRVSARASLLYSMYTIAFLGFFVWGHHMYMVGLSHTTRMLFSTLTVMISVPAATKLMHWCVTLVNSTQVMELPLFFCLLFIFFFVSGGISGMAVANTGMDILFHDTFYVVGHFHVMFAGSAMFASFGAFYFYFPSIFGVKFSRIYGYLHCFYYLIGQLMTVIPMIWLGYSGMPRRVLDYPASLGGWHAIVSAGHLLSVAGLMAFFFMIFDSLRQARAVTRNTFGITRFNTRLNFYLYEIGRNKYLQRKGWYVARANNLNHLKLKKRPLLNNERLDTILWSYSFFKKS
jgi:heme/copper-type cytochrome/quinol oxidase subunit 1